MKNSQKFKLKLLTTKVSYTLTSLLIIYIFTKYIISELTPLVDKRIVFTLYILVVLSILIILLYLITQYNNYSQEEKNKIYYDLDNNTEKIFKKFGLYITKNYIVCLGSKLNIFKLFVVPIKDIDAIDTSKDSRYYYRNKKDKRKPSILSFIKSSIKTDIMYGNNEVYVLNIISNKKIYSITTAYVLNKRKLKQIDEIANYICNKYKDIDYI